MIGTVDSELSPAVVDALLASSNAATLSPTQTFGEIKETRTIEADGKLTVVEVNKIELKDGKILMLRGGSGDVFVINVADDLKLEDASKIQLDGGLLASNVLFNFTKKDAKGEILGDSSASGMLVASGTDAVLKVEDPGSTVIGALTAGKEIAIKKDAHVISPGPIAGT